MKTITYTGPPSYLYTLGIQYQVYQETVSGWIIKDDEGVTTNVSKRHNLCWKEQTYD